VNTTEITTENATGSYLKNQTDIFNPDTQQWENTSSTENLTPVASVENETISLPYNDDIIPSQYPLDENVTIAIDQPKMAYGPGDENGGGLTAFFEDLSTLDLNWTREDRINREFTINNLNFKLSTFTHTAINKTNRSLTNFNMTMNGGWLLTNISLLIDLKISIEFDSESHHYVGIEYTSSFEFGMNIDNYTISFGTFGYIMKIESMTKQHQLGKIALFKHSSLFQKLPTTTTTTETSDTSSTTSSSDSSTESSSFTSSPGGLSPITLTTLVGVSIAIVINRKRK
jgi:hypothetical protein